MGVMYLGYSTDINDQQWNFIKPIFDSFVGNYGNQSKWDKRHLMNAVRYLNKTGCQWSLLPKDFPPYTTVSSFYHRARKSGIWEAITAALVELERINSGRNPEPSYILIDSQSAKTTAASEDRGIDGGKKS